MSAKGFWASQDGHVVNILSPGNATGGVASTPFNMKNHAHASIILQIGAQSAQMTDLTVSAATDNTMATKQAIPFRLFKQEVAGNANDVLANDATTNNGIFAIAAAGYQPSPNANIFYVIELDASELPQGYPYVQVGLANGADTDLVSAVAILSGGRYTSDQSLTATT